MRGNVPEAASTARWADVGGLILVAGTMLALCGPLLTAPAGHLPSTMVHDFFSLFHPAAVVSRGLVADGVWPLWNPYNFCGMPLLASIQMGLLYPPNWLHLLLTPARAFNVLLVGHLTFAAAGTWLYCRSQGRSPQAALLAAMTFGLSGRVILHLFAGHPHIVYSAAWLPAIFWAVDACLRVPSARRGCGLAVALAMQFLVGFPMFSLLLAYLLPAYALVMRGAEASYRDWSAIRLAVYFGVSVILALGLVAAQMLPTLEYMSQSHRGGGLDYGWSTTASFPPVNLLTFVVPGFFGDHVSYPYWGEISLWESTACCGVVTLLLAAIGGCVRPDRGAVFWGFAGLVVMSIALGKYSPVYDASYACLPGVDLFRGVSKLSVFVTLALAVLASRGFDIVFAQRADSGPGRSRLVGRLSVCLLIGAVACAAAVMFERSIDAAAPAWWQSFFGWVRRPGTFSLLPVLDHETARRMSSSYQFMLSQVLAAAVVLILATLVILNCDRLRGRGGLLLIGLTCFEVFSFARPYLETSSQEAYREPARLVRGAIEDDSLWRFTCVTTDDALTNQFAAEKLPGIGGVEASLLTRYTRVFQTLTAADPQLMTYLTMPVIHEPLFDLLNVKYYAAPPEAMRLGDSSNDRLLAEHLFTVNGLSYSLYENVDVLPRAMLVHRVREIESEEGGAVLLPALLRDGVESASFVEGTLPFPLEEVTVAEAAAESCHVTAHGPSSMTLAVELVKPGLLLVLETFYPGWEARVDGVAVDVLPANLWMRGIPVAAGAHTIELRYQPASVRGGVRLSLLSLCLLMLVGIWSLRPAGGVSLFSPMHGAEDSRADAGPGRVWHAARRIARLLAGVLYYGGLVVSALLWAGWCYRLLLDDFVPPSQPAWSDAPLPYAVAATVVTGACGWWLSRTRRRQLLFGTAALCLLGPLTLLGVEGLSRLFVPSWPAIGLHGVEPEVAARSWAKGDKTSGRVKIKDWGQRDLPRTLEAAPGVRRIAFIGDSFLEESSETPISVRVEERLGRSDVEVINLGVSASSPDEYYFRIRNIATRLDVDHCVMFVFAGNDFVESEQSLVSDWGVSAVYPRGSALTTLGFLGINHLLTNQRRPVLQAWLGAQDLRQEEELRFLTISESDDDQIRQLLLLAARVPPEQARVLQSRLADPGMRPFFDMLRHPDEGKFRSYYLSRALWSASVGGDQWDANSEDAALSWVRKAAALTRERGIDFTLVVIPEAFSVDSRMVDQWAPLTDMRHLTAPCREAADRLCEAVRADRLAGGQIEVIDLHPAFHDVPGTYLNMDGHWSDAGIELATQHVLEHLTRTGAVDGEQVVP